MSDASHDGVRAVGNLLAAIGIAMETSGNHVELRALLGMFEAMNEGNIQDPVAQAHLRAAVSTQRTVLERMGG